MAHLLIVDDEAPIRTLIRKYAEFGGHTVSEAEDGMAAVRAVRASAPDLVIMDIMMPELDGFHVQEIDSKAQMSLKYERVNGRNYGTAIWRQYVLFPQKSGKMTVPSIDFEAQIEVHNTSMDPFDIFFGGGSLSQLVKKKIKTPAVELDVKQLPSPRPDNFNGAVGSYQVSGSLTPQELKANDAATLRLVISGYGNMKLMKAPVVKFPKDFEV